MKSSHRGLDGKYCVDETKTDVDANKRPHAGPWDPATLGVGPRRNSLPAGRGDGTCPRKIVDQTQRDRAENPEMSCHVEAPAGSGKTRLLICRLLRLLARVDDPREIVALTFTNKAAAELKQRVAALFADAHAEADVSLSPEDSRLRALACAATERHAQRDLANELQVMTFHAFCGSLVQQAPAQAGVSLATHMIDESDQQRIQRDVARQLIDDLIRRDADSTLCNAAKRRLLRLNNNARRLEEQLCSLIAQRDLFTDLLTELSTHAGDPAAIAAYGTQHMRRLIETRLTATKATLTQTELGQQWTEFFRHLQSQGAMAASVVQSTLPNATWEELPRWQALADQLVTKRDGTPRKRLAKSSGFYPKFSASPWGILHQKLSGQACEALHQTRELPTADQQLTDIPALLDLLLLGNSAVTRYEAELETLRVLDFVAAEQRALAVVNPASHAAPMPRGHAIQHLLVDEFQDTSRNQWDLIRGLCAGWRANDGRTIMVVGDPKQSIYAFRKAEVALFLAAEQGIPLHDGYLLPLETIKLSCNFRADPALIHWCNNFFAHLMRDPDPEGDEVPHLRSRHPHGLDGTPAEGVQIALFSRNSAKEDRTDNDEGTPATNVADATQREAQWLAESVKAELSRPTPPQSIGILLWTRRWQDHYLEALTALNIPVQVQEGRLAHDTFAGQHLLNLARALVRPHDNLSLAALLRAPWSWVSIAELARLSQLDASTWRERIERGSVQNETTQRVFDALTSGWAHIGREPLAATVERAWLQLQGAMHTAQHDGLKGVVACRALLDLMRASDTGLPHATLSRTEQRVESCYEPPDPAAANSPVTMMTVHAAKGLEFDVVFTPYLDRNILAKGMEDAPYLLERLPPTAPTPHGSSEHEVQQMTSIEQSGGAHLMAVAQDQRKSERDATYDLLQKLQAKRRLGEAKRLCYVAFTRAKQRLYLSGTVAINDERDTVRGGKSYMQWLLDAEGIASAADAYRTHTPNSNLSLSIDPEQQTPLAAQPDNSLAPFSTEALKATPLLPEPVPYRLVSPSSLTKIFTDEAGKTPWPDDGGLSIARGVVTHAALERIALGFSAPDVARIESALRNLGIVEKVATELAPQIASEIDRCIKDPFLAHLLCEPQHFRAAEYQVEAFEDERSLLSGSMDLVVDDGKRWWIVDYKTTQPEPQIDHDTFADELAVRYGGQLQAYRRMLIRCHRLDPDAVAAGLYLTAIQRWVAL